MQQPKHTILVIDDDMDFIQLTTEGSNLSPDWSADDQQPAPAPRKEVPM